MRDNEQCVQESWDGETLLCKYHANGGSMLHKDLYLCGESLTDWKSAKVEAPQKNALRYEKGTCTRYDGKHWRKLCVCCDKYSRGKQDHCVAHARVVQKPATLSCRFFDRLERELGCGIVHNHDAYSREMSIGSYRVDGFIADRKQVIEFMGDFWHGNPQCFASCEVNTKTQTTFGKILDDSCVRLRNIAAQGYDVWFVWEKDFEDLLHRERCTDTSECLQPLLTSIASNPLFPHHTHYTQKQTPDNNELIN
jgi:G:T-mismatch repair DNA endonuclease (very short patch repair protein)